MKRILLSFLPIIFFVFFFFAYQDSIAQGQGKKEIKSWYEKKEWLPGLKAQPHRSVNIVEFAKQYKAHKHWWDKAFAYLKETDLSSLKPGRYSIDGDNVYALVTEGPTKEFDQTRWEAHKIYQDIHLVIEGKEKIGITNLSSTSLVTPYDTTKDIAFYKGKGKYYESNGDQFFLAFPGDAHRPGIKTNGADKVKKIVVKIRRDVP